MGWTQTHCCATLPTRATPTRYSNSGVRLLGIGMDICCLDLEGVLIPELWVEVAERFGCDELRVTTRDIPNYETLMRYRLNILRKRRIRLPDIQAVIADTRPLRGAKSFLKEMKGRYQIVILSDTYYEFATPLMHQLGNPLLLCNRLTISRSGYILSYHLRHKDSKKRAVMAFKGLGFRVVAAGDSYNDLRMLAAADRGVLFNPPSQIAEKYNRFPIAFNYKTLGSHLRIKSSSLIK